MDDIIARCDERVNEFPWLLHISNPESSVYKTFFADVDNQFNKRFTLFYIYTRFFKIVNDEGNSIKHPLELPLIDGNVELLFGIYI